MDANKLIVLRKIGYEINNSCAFCVHSDLSPDGWGTCDRHTYQHEKHTGDVRQLSITAYGSCETFERDVVETMRLLGSFKEFTA